MKKPHRLSIALLLTYPIFAAAQEYVFETIEFPAGFEFSSATDINNQNVVVGYQESETLESRVFLWDAGVTTFPAVDLDFALPFGINDDRTIVGSGLDEDFFDDEFTLPSFSFSNGDLELFSFPGAFATYATGINNNGVIVGGFETFFDDAVRSFIKEEDSFTELTIPELNDATASGINDAGTIVGGFFEEDTSSGFILNGGVTETVTHPDGGSELISLNNSGLYVGIVTPDQGSMRGFVYDGSEFVDVAYPGAEETFLTGINDSGVLVGSYFLNDQELAFIARPVHEPQLSCEPLNDLLGDIDSDGTVAFSDFLILSENFGTELFDSESNSYALGDLDCSGGVVFGDFLILSSNFGNSLPAASVPGPSGLPCLGLGFVCVLCGFRRYR